MIKEALAHLLEVGRKADAATVTKVDGKPRSVLVSQGGEREWVALDPPLRKPRLTELDSFVSVLNNEVGEKRREVYLSQSEIVGLFDADDRLERVQFPLTNTEVWRRLHGLTSWQKLEPPAAVRFLKELGASATVVDALRKIDFRRAEGARAETRHGSESLGREVEAKVQGAENIPEGFNLVTAVYIDAGCRHQVTIPVQIYLDVMGKTVDLRVCPDDLALAQAEVLGQIVIALERDLKEGIAVYRGNP